MWFNHKDKISSGTQAHETYKTTLSLLKIKVTDTTRDPSSYRYVKL